MKFIFLFLRVVFKNKELNLKNKEFKRGQKILNIEKE